MDSGSVVGTPQKPFPTSLPSDGHRGGHTHQSPQHHTHPYAIKTTSTALLSRTNSTGNRVQSHHSYVPTSPCPSPAAKHRFTKSESVIGYPSMPPASPRPLPIPPSLESPTKDTADNRRVKYDNARLRTWSAGSPPPSPVKTDDLPSNPRIWSTSQLSSYLVTALRIRNGENLPVPPPVARDIVTFVKEAKLTGRTFLRLSEQDLEQLGINHLWRSALLGASRRLRQNVLKGRIWGFDDDENFQSPFSHMHYNSSSSSIESVTSLGSTPHKAIKRNGRVRGMVENLERSGSISSNSSCDSFDDATANRTKLVIEKETIASDAETHDDSHAHCSHSSSGVVICASPISNSVDLPSTPPQGPFAAFAGEVFVASQTPEPSIQELLARDDMSMSWGAKAWEQFDIASGITMKRLEPDFGASSAVEADGHKRYGTGSGEGEKTGGGRVKAEDVFPNTRPLPTPPPGVSTNVSDPQQTPTKPPKKQRGVQVDLERVETVDAVLQTETSPAENSGNSSSEELKETLALLEEYRERLTLVEAKLAALECVDEFRAKSFASQTVQTQLISGDGGDVVALSLPVCSNNPVKPGDSSVHTAHTMEIDVELNSNATRQSPVETSEHTPSDTSRKLLALSAAGLDRPEGEERDRSWEPLEQGLSSYVLMVGVGICTVVLQTLLRRLAGKKA